MAELQQVGSVDPAAQEQLMQDLRNSDPAIWPLVMQQFRATQAYRNRLAGQTALAQRTMGAEEASRLPPVSDSPMVAEAPIQIPPPCVTPTPPIALPPVEEPSRESVVQTAYVADETAPPILPTIPEPIYLKVCNLTFCKEVLSFGNVKRFDKDEFRPNQETLLYVEVENFVSKQTPNGYRTSLKSSYRIFNGQGRCVDEHTFATTEDDCENVRRDFFLGYRVRLPEKIEPGTYRLVLTVEDLGSNKLGQAEVFFEIVEKTPPESAG